MKRVLSCFIILLAAAAIWAQNTVISGTVSDAATGRPVGGASVTAGKWSVVTNDDGFFTLKTGADGTVTTVTVSHVGYQPQKVKLDGGTKTPLQIRLKPTTIQLQEVLVMADNARALVEKAISQIPRNYSTQPELLHCFYRETAMKRQKYILVAEGVVDMYKTSYARLDNKTIGQQDFVESGRDRVGIVKGRRLLSPKASDTLSVKVMGGPVMPVQLDVVKNPDILLDEEELNYYDLKMEAPTSIGDRMQYVVSLAPRHNREYPLYYGRLYIDKQTLAFTRADLSLDMSDRAKVTNMILVRKPTGVRFRPKELSVLVDYRQGDDGVTRISYLRTTFRFNCDWRRRLFATSFIAVCEMAVTDKAEGEAKPIRGHASFDRRDAFFDKVEYFRDPEFWQDYNIIEPSESLDKAVHKLLKSYQ